MKTTPEMAKSSGHCHLCRRVRCGRWRRRAGGSGGGQRWADAWAEDLAGNSIGMSQNGELQKEKLIDLIELIGNMMIQRIWGYHIFRQTQMFLMSFHVLLDVQAPPEQPKKKLPCYLHPGCPTWKMLSRLLLFIHSFNKTNHLFVKFIQI